VVIGMDKSSKSPLFYLDKHIEEQVGDNQIAFQEAKINK
jgi:hypothetical protein